MSAISIKPNQNVLFAVNPIDRLGDLGAAIKLAQAFIKRGILTSEQVEVRSTKSYECFNCYPFEIQPLTTTIRLKTKLIEASNLALQIIASASGYGESYFFLRRKNVSTLSLTEYGFEADPLPALSSIYRSLSLGLSEKSIGIYIEPDWEAQHQLNSRELRMQQLDKASLKAQERVRGKHDTFALYVGYSDSNDLRLGFIHAILQKNKEDQTIVFVLPRFNAPEKLLQVVKGFEVQTVILSSETGEETHSINEEGRVVRFCIGDFDHSDLRLITQASEDEMLVTGDQTVSEAISANKQFCYEVRNHKETFARSLSTLFREFCQDLVNPNIRQRESDTTEYYSKQILRIFDPAFRQPFSEFNRHVCIERNCIPIIEQNALEMAQQTQKQRIIYLYDVPAFDHTKLENNTVYIVNLYQIAFMQISERSGISQRPELAGKTYESRALGADTYYLIQYTD